jgi:hypothetical protein
MRRISTRSATVACAALLGLGSGCFNDAFRGDEFDGVPGAERFELVVEPDRTLVDGTHFLVDRATGDLWRLELSDRKNGAWVRLADGPDDAVELAFQIGPARPEED